MHRILHMDNLSGTLERPEALLEAGVRRTDMSSPHRPEPGSFGGSMHLLLTGRHIRDTRHQPPLSLIHLGVRFILFEVKRIWNSSIKELRGVPCVQHSNESMAKIPGPFNRQKLVFNMLRSPIWRNLSGGEERQWVWKTALRRGAALLPLCFCPSSRIEGELSRVAQERERGTQEERKHNGEN